MAKTDGAVMDPETSDGVATDGVATTKKAAKPGIFTVLPTELIQAVSDRGEAENKPNGRVVAECVAQLFGYELPPMDRARRGGTTKDSTGLSSKNKNAAIIKLLEMADAGEIELTPDLKALLGR